MTDLRVLHCPAAVGGNPAGLAAAERRLGLRSRSVTLEDPPFGYAVDDVLWRQGQPAWKRQTARLRLFAQAWRDADVVHFNFGRTIAPGFPTEPAHSSLGRIAQTMQAGVAMRDLGVLSRAGKVLAATFQGDDVRQVAELLDLGGQPVDRLLPADYYSADLDRSRRRTVEAFDRHADLLYAVNPDLLRVLPERAQFLPYASVDPSEIRPQDGPVNDVPVLLHAPTHRGIKGTELVAAAFDSLRLRGVRFEQVLVEGMDHADALAAYRRADIVVDQVLLGWYGALAVEAMSMAKPVVAYIREADRALVPPEMARDLPVISARPEDLADVLERLIGEPHEARLSRGRAARRWVERWHDPRAIASRLAGDYSAAMEVRQRSGRSASVRRPPLDQ